MLQRVKILTDIGVISVVSEHGYIIRIYLPGELSGTELNEWPSSSECPTLDSFRREITEYFAGKRQVFEVDWHFDGTLFQRSVLDETQKISYGSTVTYKEIATNIGRPYACRAVGNGLNRNKLPILIPCHRVVGSNSKFGGYRGGNDMKEFLLALENRNMKRF